MIREGSWVAIAKHTVISRFAPKVKDNTEIARPLTADLGYDAARVLPGLNSILTKALNVFGKKQVTLNIFLNANHTCAWVYLTGKKVGYAWFLTKKSDASVISARKVTLLKVVRLSSASLLAGLRIPGTVQFWRTHAPRECSWQRKESFLWIPNSTRPWQCE